jgi:hypothetical protein
LSHRIGERFRAVSFDDFANLVQALVQALGIRWVYQVIYRVFLAVRFRSGRRGRKFESCHPDFSLTAVSPHGEAAVGEK